MPASLYKLANKPHHAETPTVVDQKNLEIETFQTVDAANTVVEGESQAQELNAPQSSEVGTTSTTAELEIPSWDPNWTKTKLLDFALSLGLSVTSTNTKNEIISALTAATSK